MRVSLRWAMRPVLLSLALLASPPAAAADRAQPAPDFSAKLLEGDETLRLADYRGKVVYLDFWASWCGPCRQSLPWLQELRREFRTAGFEVIAVNVDEEPADARRFLQRYRVSYPVVGDARGRIAALYDVQDMPSSYLIDRRGHVRAIHRGFRRSDAGKLRDAVARLVAEQP